MSKTSMRQGIAATGKAPFIITPNELFAWHPEGVVSSTDDDYLAFANRLARQHWPLAKEVGMDKVLFRLSIMKVISYYEDIIADSGMWRAFTELHKHLYGKPLPFYDIEGEYVADEPSLEDVLYLLWDATNEFQPESVTNPENLGLKKMAVAIYESLEQNFEDMPINEELAKHFREPDWTDDWQWVRNQLLWVAGSCYITRGHDHFRCLQQTLQKVGAMTQGSMNKEMAQYHSAYAVSLEKKCGPLALYPKQWLAAFMHASGNDNTIDIDTIQATETIDFWLVSSQTNSTVTLTNSKTESITIATSEMASGELLRTGDGYIGQFASYRGLWRLSGVGAPIEGLFKNWANIMAARNTEEKSHLTPGYEKLMEMSGGSPLLYPGDRPATEQIITEQMGLTTDMIIGYNLRAVDKGVVMFTAGADQDFHLMPNVGIAIKDERNAAYDKHRAPMVAFNMICAPLTIPSAMLHYLLEHDMLPDATFGAAVGGKDHGRELMQQNLDFMARTMWRSEY